MQRRSSNCATMTRTTSLLVFALVAAQHSSGDEIAVKLESQVLRISAGNNEKPQRYGTGFLVSADGFALTAAHVVQNPDNNEVWPKVQCVRIDGDSEVVHDAKVLKCLGNKDEGRDIAIIRLALSPGEKLPYLDLGGSDEVGNAVFIAGFPLVFDNVIEHPIFRHGIVANNRISVNGSRVVLLDITGVVGFSGAPVVDQGSGRAIGVFRGHILREGVDFSGAFAIGVDEVLELRALEGGR